MEKTLNEINVKTSKNFGMNNIVVNTDFPKSKTSFDNLNIDVKSTKDKVIELDKTENLHLTYGVGLLDVSKINKNILIEVNSKMENPIKLDFYFDESNKYLEDNIEIVANENTSSTIFISYRSKRNIKSYHNGVLKVSAKKNSKVNVIIINLLNEVSDNFYSIEDIIEDRGCIKYTIIDFGAKNSISNLYSNVVGENANNIINSIYLGKGNDLIDINYIVDMRGKAANVNIDAQGALTGNARKHFKGSIDFKTGCKKAVGDENESCMLLSDTAKSLSLPMLLCSEEDVIGNHSTGSGKADKKELFYLESRGFSEKEALKLLVRAKFNTILNNIKDKAIYAMVVEEIDKIL